MKKCVSIVVMICLSVSLLMGCGGSGEGDKDQGAQSGEKAQVKTASAAAPQQAKAKGDKPLDEELPSQTDGYVIFVKDANTNEPLAGVRVQFCSDSECMMGMTDGTGTAVFNVDPGNYEAHILKPSAGYQKNKETAELTADDRIAVFALLKEGEELSKELAEKDCQIIGICTDLDDDNVQQAIKILEDNGVTYTNIKQTDELAKTLLTIGLPTTYLVDSEGRVLTVPVRGANFAKYREKIEEALKAVH